MNRKFMDLAVMEALKGAGATSPNPMVGAVLVHENRVLSQGHHEKYGQAHAEVNALKAFSETSLIPDQSILYVTLEPCCHLDKKTPPCAQMITNSNIQRVVIGELDPNPKVAGQGVEILKAAGIDVQVIGLGERVPYLYEGFKNWIQNNKPFFHLKWAQTLDGKMATNSGDSKWITGEEARENAHYIRQVSDVLITGAGTVRADSPKLNARIEDLKPYSPIVFVITKNNDVDTSSIASQAIVLKTDDIDMCPFEWIENWMIQNKKMTAMIEGGPKLISSFLKAKKAHRLHSFIAGKVLGQGIHIGSTEDELEFKQIKDCFKYTNISWKSLGDDAYFSALSGGLL